MSRYAGKISALVHKDWMIGRRFLLVAFPVYLLYALMFFQAGTLFIFVSMLFSLFLALGAVIIEEKTQGDTLLCSFPVKRIDIVYARYLTAGLGAGLGMFVTFAVGFVLDIMFAKTHADFNPTMTFAGFLGFFLLLATSVALFFPFYFKYGFFKGGLIFLSVSLLFSILTGAVFNLAWLMARKSASTGLGAFFKDPYKTMVHGIGSIAKAVGPLFLLQAVLILIAGLVWLSILISVRMYSGRDI
jgi:ABC-type transport system involved in multi-copper enzyme maturation permease subunit